MPMNGFYAWITALLPLLWLFLSFTFRPWSWHEDHSLSARPLFHVNVRLIIETRVSAQDLGFMLKIGIQLKP